MYTLDTNILIYYAAGDDIVVSFMNKNKNAIFYLPTVVAMEFLSYPLIKPETVLLFKFFLTQVRIVSLDLNLAEQSSEIRKKYKLQLADAIIAASTIYTNSTLVTRNVKDFRKIINLRILSL